MYETAKVKLMIFLKKVNESEQKDVAGLYSVKRLEELERKLNNKS